MGPTLREFREAKQWSQKKLAAELSKIVGRKLRQSHISAYEAGVMPSWDIGEAIKKVTGGKVSAAAIPKKAAQ